MNQPLRVLDLFSGIGGFSLGLERAGMQTVAFCEIDPFCRRVLAKHWPHVPCYDDVRTLTASRLRADGIDPGVICGGFPCQDVSVAGRRAGLDGTRSGLWSEFRRLVCEVRPTFVVVENTTGLLSLGMETVLGDLAALGYDAEWHCIPASAVGAPQERDRVWIVADAYKDREPGLVTGADIGASGSWGPRGAEDLQTLASAPYEPGDRWPRPLIRGNDDRPANWMDRIGACGNAVVPQIPEMIGRAIIAASEVAP